MFRVMKVTDTNVFALSRAFGSFDKLPASTRFDVATLPHLRRCVAAGLVEMSADRAWMCLTDAGVDALAKRAAQ
jgi:hypothetical protein